jgi:hypothetical protein
MSAIEDSDDLPTFIVRRESSFQRVAADYALPFFLGDDIEIALAITTPELKSMSIPSDDEGKATVGTTPIYVETTRIRMRPEAAANMAFTIIHTLFRADELSLEKARENLDMMAKLRSAAEESDK